MEEKTLTARTKDELLVENAILKYNEQVRKMLKEELLPFSASIKELNQRVDVIESEVETIKEIVEPFATFKKRIWFIVIALSLSIGIAGEQITKWITGLIK